MGRFMARRIAFYSCLVGALMASDKAVGENPVAKDQDKSSVVIVLGGDLGLGGSRQPVSPKGGYRHGKLLPWKSLTSGIEPILAGDINFANLETVVTDQRKLAPVDKTFTFQMHANGVRHLVNAGFNVFSTANNHSRDYGAVGMRETLRHLKALQGDGLLAYPGLGAGRDQAIAPSLLTVKGSKIAISALGIGGVAPGRANRRIGQPSYHSKADFNDTIAALAGAEANYKILSAHYGRELSLRPSMSAVSKLRDQTVKEQDIDLVVGHHTHVAGGIQRVGRKLILYGLGNLLHLGMQDMGKFSHCRDFGLIVRLHLQSGNDKRLRAAAIEAIPLTRMHAQAEPQSKAASEKRIGVLNGLAAELDDETSGALGVRFKVNDKGHGVYCFGDETGQQHPMCSNSGEALRDVSAVKCGRLSKSVLARSSRNRSKRGRRKTAGAQYSQGSSGFAQSFFKSVYGN